MDPLLEVPSFGAVAARDSCDRELRSPPDLSDISNLAPLFHDTVGCLFETANSDGFGTACRGVLRCTTVKL